MAFISCTKSDNEELNTYYVKGKKDGVAFKYNANSGASIHSYFVGGDSFTTVSFKATPYANAANLQGLNVTIHSFKGATPSTGMYTEENTNQHYNIWGIYNPNSTTIKWMSGAYTPSAKPLKINVLTKNATEMTGTFEGAFYKQDVNNRGSQGEYLLFTECEFKLPVR